MIALIMFNYPVNSSQKELTEHRTNRSQSIKNSLFVVNQELTVPNYQNHLFPVKKIQRPKPTHPGPGRFISITFASLLC
jgi:hypothetical protein